MKCLADIPVGEIKGKRVLLRAGLDVPLENGEVADGFRIRRSVSTIEYLKHAGAKTIILSHIGRDGESLRPVADALKRLTPVSFVSDIFGREARLAMGAIKDGDALLLENLRTDPREVENDDGFAKELAALGDFYVDDAFSNAHRVHASMVGIPKYLPHSSGISMCEEIEKLSPARQPVSPALAVLGGAKFETKEPLITSFLDSYDHVFVCGALANDVFKARGFEVGKTIISEMSPSESVLSHPKFLAPIDVTVECADGQAKVKKPEDVLPDERIVDMGPDSFALLSSLISRARFVLWNGPTGIYEEGYGSWTHATAESLSVSSARSVIGGNNTLAAIRSSGVAEDKFGFLSTGGGAMLEFLLKGTLPAIDALK